ncbi:MAG: HD domain-containing protein [Phycicoccus sp.]
MTGRGGICHSEVMDPARRRWHADCSRLTGLDPREIEAVGEDLLHRWSEPHRRYHGLTHLHEVLAAVDVLSRTGDVRHEDRTVAVLGAWFHDAVYDLAAAGTNEARSADLARESLSLMGVPTSVIDRVATVILDTVDHELPDEAAADPARGVLHDADLWVLAAPLARFDEYCAQVRDEYAHLAGARYALARSRVLRPLLGRRHLYATGYARAAWNGLARENLARELTRLAG